MTGRKRVVVLGAAVLLLTAAGTVPSIWRTVDRYEGLVNAQALGLVSRVVFSASPLLMIVTLLSLGVAGAERAALGKTVAARALFSAGAVIASLFVLSALRDVTLRRSRAVDSWPVCETAVSPHGFRHQMLAQPHAPWFEGPHLEDGTGCSRASEDRRSHSIRHPDGDVLDGLKQVASRFPADRPLVFGGIPAALAALLLAVGLFLGATRRKSPDGGETQAPSP